MLGGDHSSPFGLIKELSNKYESFGIIQFDAHMDLRNSYEGFTWSHASIIYNISKQIPQVSKIIQVGIRDLCKPEYEKYQKNKPASVRLFDFLDNLNEEQIDYLLKTEKETVMALAIDQVSTSKRNTFLNALNPDVKNHVIRELGNLKSIPLEMVVNIAKELEKKASFLPEPKVFSRGGGKKIADILNQMSEDEANSYLTQLINDDPETYAEVKKYLLTFDDLLNMSEDIAADFWANPDIDLDDLCQALKGVDSDQTSSIIEMLPKKKQAMYTPIEKPLKKKDVMASRKSIVKVATDMTSSGELRVEDILSGVDDEMIE